MKIYEIITENTNGQGNKTGGPMQKPSKEQKASMRRTITMPDQNMSSGSAYLNYRMGIALAGAPTYPTQMPGDSWIGGDPLLNPYTKEEFEMVKAAARQVGGGTVENWTGDRSKEVADVNKTSPVAKPKRNKYGI